MPSIRRAAELLDLVRVRRVRRRGGPFAVGVLVVRLGEQPDQPVTSGQVERQHLVAERGLRGGERVLVVRAGVVELGDHDGPRHADLVALVPQRLGRLVDALVRRDDEQGAVGGPEAGPQFADEIGVPGGVDQVDLDAVVRQRGQRRARPTVAAGSRRRRSRRPWCRPGRCPVWSGRRRPPAGPRRGWSCRRRTGRRAPRCGWRPGCPQRGRLRCPGKCSSCLP